MNHRQYDKINHSLPLSVDTSMQSMLGGNVKTRSDFQILPFGGGVLEALESRGDLRKGSWPLVAKQDMLIFSPSPPPPRPASSKLGERRGEYKQG